jgi:hypothetical protein
MTREYRVMERDGELAIDEVYYDEDGGVQGYGGNVAFPAGATLDALRENCQRYLGALAKPVLK